MSTTPHTITLKVGDDGMIRKEGVAASAVTPGMLVKRTSAGVAAQSAAGGYVPKAFALENDLVGDDIDDAYDADDTVQIGIFGAGCEVYAFLAYGENVVIGDALSAAAGGALQKQAGTEPTIAFALEAVNNNAAGLDRIKVEVA